MWQPIQDWVVLRVGGLSYDVYVKEFGFEVFNKLFNYDDQKQSHDDDVFDSKSSSKPWQEGEEASSVKGGEEEEWFNEGDLVVVIHNDSGGLAQDNNNGGRTHNLKDDRRIEDVALELSQKSNKNSVVWVSHQPNLTTVAEARKGYVIRLESEVSFTPSIPLGFGPSQQNRD